MVFEFAVDKILFGTIMSPLSCPTSNFILFSGVCARMYKPESFRPVPLLCKQQGQLNTGIELAMYEIPERDAQSMIIKCLQTDNHLDIIKPESIRRLKLQGDLIGCVVGGDR